MHLRNAVVTLGLLVFTIACIPSAQSQTMGEGAVLSNPASQVHPPVPAQLPPAAAPQTPPAQTTPAQTTPAQTAPAPPAAGNQQPQQTTEEAVPLRVMMGKSLLINTTDRLKRVSVTDPNVADAVVVTPHQIMVHGRAPGEVSLVIWDEQERSRSFDLRVDVDVSSAAEEIHRIFPEEQINVSASRSAIVLSGHVSTQEIAERAGKVAEAYSKNVVNVLAFGPVGAQEISLEVKFAEVNRTALTQWGFNLFSTGATNTIGQTTTEQFGGLGPLNLQDTTPIPVKPDTSFSTAFTIADLMNMFVFRPDIHLGAVIKALQEHRIAQVLAEPNLIAVNGKEASFLAGGEFPVPVVQGAAGLNSVTIIFKEFGVRLAFTPTIMPNGNIHLAVKPEVSTLDFADGIRLQGFVVPALTTRRASTELELKDGQSFVIAGLLDNRLSKDMNKLPGIGDIPILGYFFKSKDFNRSNDELMVLVTVHRVFASDQQPPLPKNPEKFLNPDRFDKSSFDKLGGALAK